ncbi:FAD synthetase family protein [Bacillus salipaludis]|uniref:FAD synthase n=1 Tax=Bacillus salipaludis TaxID=2547811 RepID=A0A4R5VVZ9_9BACI|nr:FAD synthetase family protein [Bacillus salipaludis]MDQ6597229.1 FAD synthetase family protein [Bacillus salipaludis]TDK63326.1 FAD synthetase family protein [Bacillus salipaludis]
MQTFFDGALQLSASVLTIGALDGVHKGHQALIKTAKGRAIELGVPLVVYTFDPPPRVYFKNALLLSSLSEKLLKLQSLGVDICIIAPFNEHYMTKEVSSFIEEIGELNPVEIWEGPDFHFGKNREGNISTLQKYFSVKITESLRCPSGEVISSSRIRSLIKENKRVQAEQLLGWNHAASY